MLECEGKGMPLVMLDHRAPLSTGTPEVLVWARERGVNGVLSRVAMRGWSPPGSEVAQRRECAWERVGVPLNAWTTEEGRRLVMSKFALGVSNRRMFHQRDSMHQARGGE